MPMRCVSDKSGLTGATWVMLDEVHGTDVIDIDAGDSWPIAGTGDVLMADRSDQQLAVWAADCAPIALFGANGTARVVIHAGWRGLADGIIDVALDALESSGTHAAIAVLGPCIHGVLLRVRHRRPRTSGGRRRGGGR